ncbi:MAG: DNA recombination protein RmuC [Bacteroidales bacterium]|jgi:DNA recombination protein RmuC|nr:DNA recombination protein RmuC [Bacteroidales bacterium]
MPEVLIYVVFALLVVALVVLFILSSKQGRMIRSLKEDNEGFMKDLSQNLKDYHKENKDDYERAQTSQREEISERMKDMRESQKDQIESLKTMQEQRLKSMEESQKERLSSMEKQQQNLMQTTEKSLDKMRDTVEEKLEKTLNDRISKSFETVGNQLDNVKNGLAEMRDLAKDVGGLKKVLSNVKMRGGLGEVQLQMLLEQYLAPGQYVANAHTGEDKNAVVEFAVRFPGQDGNPVLLPIDSKFPKDRYDALLEAYESADKDAMDGARREFCSAIKNEAKNISKYINVPETTPFAIMFLPFEGLYAEVARDNNLLESLQKEFSITVAGPTNLSAILTSFQMGFRTLAIQKKGSDVWKVLGEVKTEFGKFGDMLEKAKGKIQGGLEDMDKLITTRTNQINRKLRDVEADAVSIDTDSPSRLLEEE